MFCNKSFCTFVGLSVAIDAYNQNTPINYISKANRLAQLIKMASDLLQSEELNIGSQSMNVDRLALVKKIGVFLIRAELYAQYSLVICMEYPHEKNRAEKAYEDAMTNCSYADKTLQLFNKLFITLKPNEKEFLKATNSFKIDDPSVAKDLIQRKLGAELDKIIQPSKYDAKISNVYK